MPHGCNISFMTACFVADGYHRMCPPVACSLFSHRHVLPWRACTKTGTPCKQSEILPDLWRCSYIITTSSPWYNLGLCYICVRKMKTEILAWIWDIHLQSSKTEGGKVQSFLQIEAGLSADHGSLITPFPLRVLNSDWLEDEWVL